MESCVDFAGGQRIQVARSIDCGSIWVSRVNLRTRDLTNRREPAHALQLSLSLPLSAAPAPPLRLPHLPPLPGTSSRESRYFVKSLMGRGSSNLTFMATPTPAAAPCYAGTRL